MNNYWEFGLITIAIFGTLAALIAWQEANLCPDCKGELTTRIHGFHNDNS